MAGANHRSIPGLSLRVTEIDGTPWFLATDVCKAISLSTDNVRRSLKPDQVNSVKLTGLRGLPPLLVTEAGLYRLVMRSTKPEAVEFQDWVTDVVLPAIRKDGAYVMGEEKVATGELSIEAMTLRVIAADVCKAIGHSNVTVAVQSLESADRAKLNLDPLQAPVNIVSESGLYTLSLRSRKEQTRAFRHWITSVVLPAIRKTGGYMTPEVAQAAILVSGYPVTMRAKIIGRWQATSPRIGPPAQPVATEPAMPPKGPCAQHRSAV